MNYKKLWIDFLKSLEEADIDCTSGYIVEQMKQRELKMARDEEKET